MNFDTTEGYVDYDHDFKESDLLVKTITLGFTSKGRKAQAFLTLNVPHGSDFDLAHDQLRLLSWLYYNYFVFQHIGKIITSSGFSRRTRILESMDSIIIKAERSRNKFLRLFKDLIQKENLDLKVDYFYEDSKEDEVDLKDLNVIQSFTFDNFNGNGLCFMEIFDGALFYKTNPMYSFMEMSHKMSEIMYDGRFEEASTVVSYFDFFENNLLNLSSTNTLVDDEDLLDILEQGINICNDFKNKLNEKKDSKLEYFPVRFERSFIDKNTWHLMN